MKNWVGKAVPRKEGLSKIRGQARYIDDITFPNMLHGITIRSTCPRGKIKKITYKEGVPWKEITVVTAKDIPGKNIVTLIEQDQPYLADSLVNHPEEPILLLAHKDKGILEKARKLVEIEYEPLPAVFTIEDSLSGSPIIWGKDNIFRSFLIEKGDLTKGFKNAYKIIEAEYRTGAQEQLYIEPNGVIATANKEEGVTVWGSMQCPYYVHKALKGLFALPPEQIRVIQTETGGGFGGKEEYPSLIAGHAALLAWKTGRSVKIIYDREEDMAATTKRHPSHTKIRAGVDKKGKLLALEIDFKIDGGAYITLSPVVLSRGTLHSAGPYLCENVCIRSAAVATNCPPHGAFRGFGAPQSIFAMERHMDRIAKELGISPEQVRKINFIKTSETLAMGQIVKDKIDMPGILDAALKKSNYKKKITQFKKTNSKSKTRRGLGMATFYHGAGFTGSGEKYLASMVGVEALKDGKIRILTANTEIGQGTNTIFSQIAADALGLDYSDIIVDMPDTKWVPDSGPTVASRTCMIVGKLVESACLKLKDTLQTAELLKKKYTRQEFQKACAAYIKKNGRFVTYFQYNQPPGVNWDDKKYTGDAYGSYAWAAYIAEVEIDLSTYQTTVTNFVAVQEVGKVVHPVLAEGQIVGGVAQGVGYALYENVVWKKGRMVNSRMTNYIMPTSMDAPPIQVVFKEVPTALGPQGAKGIGELPMDGPAPAILNAIENALGVSLSEIPLTPEMLMTALEGEAR